MKRETEKRIERLESKANLGKGVRAVCVRYVEPGFINRPVSGWTFGPWGEQTEVLRNKGESDKELINRAIAFAREKLGVEVPCLTSLG